VVRGDEISDAVLDITAGDRIEWSVAAWRQLLRELRSCDMTINDWLSKLEEKHE